MEFTVLGARPVKYAAAPMLALDLQVAETAGREIYMLALTIQLMIEPARRAYDEGTHERLVELFGAPERWAVTTRSLVWSTLDVVVPAFTGHDDRDGADQLPLRPGAGGRQVPALAARRRGAPGTALQRHGLLPTRGRGLQIVLLPWITLDRLPDACEGLARDDRALLPGHRWVGLRSSTLEALQREKRERGLATLDATMAALLRKRWLTTSRN